MPTSPEVRELKQVLDKISHALNDIVKELRELRRERQTR